MLCSTNNYLNNINECLFYQVDPGTFPDTPYECATFIFHQLHFSIWLWLWPVVATVKEVREARA